MADFSSTEKTNASWKHLFGIVGTSNGNGATGKTWYEEIVAASHIIVAEDIWSTPVPIAGSLIQALANVGPVVANRSSGEDITLVANGPKWDITTVNIIPRVGFQVTNIHPNPSYIRSITNVLDNGGNNYTITLNSNVGVAVGPAVLHSRVYLTVDPTSNSKAWFSRKVYGDSFSDTIRNFIHPTKFGRGYSVRMFRANGQEVFTTEGAWIFNWQKGLLIFAGGYTPVDLSYQQPLYIEGFEYTGTFGVGGTIIPDGELHDTLRFDGTDYVPTSAVKSDGNNLYIENKLVISGSLVTASGLAPAVSGSFYGDKGDIRWDNHFLYVKTEEGWARVTLGYF